MNTNLSQFTAVIGIDWADAKHDICVQSVDADAREFSRIAHKVEALMNGHAVCMNATVAKWR